MNNQSLIATGLSALQATVYAMLIEFGEARPPEVAAKLSITRSNAYKVLDKLVEMKLASKHEVGKKITYRVLNPIALASMTAEFRSQATAREEAVQNIMHELLARYHTHSDKPGVSVFTGRKDVADAYHQQIGLHEDIRFIHTDSDVALMGFDTMHKIRTTPAQFNNQREAIMFPGGRENLTINTAQHKRSNLSVTYANTKDYSAPVEWSVTDSSLLIVLYATEPHAILIMDTVVASSFLQLFYLLQNLLQQQSTHQAITRSLKN